MFYLEPFLKVGKKNLVLGFCTEPLWFPPEGQTNNILVELVHVEFGPGWYHCICGWKLRPSALWSVSNRKMLNMQNMELWNMFERPFPKLNIHASSFPAHFLILINKVEMVLITFQKKKRGKRNQNKSNDSSLWQRIIFN